jgi:signal transduction histidine kinase/CheY-like chemotaxis protein
MMDDRERAELDALREEVGRLRAELGARRDERRAALNLMEDALEARREAEAASGAKDEFLAIVGHELRTPLTAIVLWAQALRHGLVDAREVPHAIAALEQSADCQARLIDDLLDLSRLSSGKLALARESADVAAIVSAAIEAVRPLATAKRIALHTEIDPNLGTASLDGTRLTQVLWNLLTNAIKFTLDDGLVRVSVRKRDGKLEIDVVDDGEGIPAEFLPHVFDKFRQADMRMDRSHMGLGIGLTLSKELVELHGGTIEARSEGIGRGAELRVVVPWIAAAAAAKPKRDLELVDAHALERAGAKVTAVASAVAALGQLHHIDVLVSDLALPGMSGLELVARASASCKARGSRALPSCAISAHTRDADRKGAIDAGFDIFLPKPVTPARLIEAVADLRAML